MRRYENTEIEQHYNADHASRQLTIMCTPSATSSAGFAAISQKSTAVGKFKLLPEYLMERDT